MSQRVLLGYFVTLFQSSVNVNIYARFTPVEKKRKFHHVHFFQWASTSRFPSTSGLSESVSVCILVSVCTICLHVCMHLGKVPLSS